MENQIRTLSGINILAGLWLVVAPFILSYASQGNIWQEVLFGAIVIVLGLTRLGMPENTWPSWTNFVVGLWLIIAPWVISGTTTAAKWNEAIVGIIIAILAYTSAETTRKLSHRTL